MNGIISRMQGIAGQLNPENVVAGFEMDRRTAVVRIECEDAVAIE
jgi:hypothetical protein